MGLSGGLISKAGVGIAKNYYTLEELKSFNLIVDQRLWDELAQNLVGKQFDMYQQHQRAIDANAMGDLDPAVKRLEERDGK